MVRVQLQILTTEYHRQEIRIRLPAESPGYDERYSALINKVCRTEKISVTSQNSELHYPGLTIEFVECKQE